MTLTVHISRRGGVLIPVSDEDMEALLHMRAGEVWSVKLKPARNYRFHRKWFALARYAYDVWLEHKPEDVRHIPFNDWRKDLIKLAGYWVQRWHMDGSFTLEPKSIAFENMDEAEFEKLYSDTINTILRTVSGMHGIGEKELRSVVEQTLEFA